MDEDSSWPTTTCAPRRRRRRWTGTAAGGKQACKNCSCGLKEMLEDEDSNMVEVPGVVVRQLHLGDAYRCAGCPHLGKPAWDENAGEELKLAQQLPADAVEDGVVADDKPLAGKGVGGVVKLSLGDTMDDF